MKKVLVLMLAVIMVLSSFMLVGCDNGEQSDGDKSTTTTTTQNSTTGSTSAEEQTTLPAEDEQSTTVADGEQTTTDNAGESTTGTTAKQETSSTTNKTTTTTKKPTTTTTKKPTTTTEKVVTDSQGVSRKERTEKVAMYEVNEWFEIGAKQERTITYKGTIKIGNTAATTGAYAQYGGVFNEGLEAYVNAVNFNGGVGGDYAKGIKGYYVEFVHYDDKFDSYKGYSYTKKLVEEDKVFALVGHFGSPTVGATIDYIKQKGVIACYFASGTEELYNTNATSTSKGSTLFPVQPIYTTEGRIMVGRIIQQYPDAKKIGVIYTPDGEIGLGIRDGAKAQVKALGAGYESVVAEAALNNTASYNTAVKKVADCDVVIVASGEMGTTGIINAMITNGIYKPVFTSYSVAAAQTLIDIKADYDTLAEEDKFPIYANAWLSSTDVNSYLDFCEDILGYVGNNESIAGSYAMAGWIAADVFFQGLERVVLQEDKGITTANFVKAMESKKLTIPMGWSTEAGDSKLDYSNGYRLGTTTMGLLKNNDTCNAFEEAAGMKDYMNFIKTGNVKYAK